MSRTKASTRLIAEFLIIVVSILAAFGVEELREEWAKQELKDLALENIRNEVERNVAALDSVIPYHEEVRRSIGQLLPERSAWQGLSGFQAGGRIAPRGIQPPELGTVAWETAQATGAVALFDYELSQRIAGVYAGQRRGVDATVGRLVDHIFARATFGTDDTEAFLQLLGAIAGELLSQERRLREELQGLLSAMS